MYKLGIDVGGTNTDAVLIDENRAVIADIKYPTSADIYDGILGAMRTVLEVSGVDPKHIHQAMLGTTQCTNAIVERKNLAPIGILRIGAPATTGIRPMVDWAEDIQKVAVGSAIIGGGFEYDGKELAPFDVEAAKAFFTDMKAKGVKSVAISCVFSTVAMTTSSRPQSSAARSWVRTSMSPSPARSAPWALSSARTPPF